MGSELVDIIQLRCITVSYIFLIIPLLIEFCLLSMIIIIVVTKRYNIEILAIVIIIF